MKHSHDIVEFIGMQEDGRGGYFPLFNCVDHPIKHLPRMYPCHSTFTDYVYGGQIDFSGSYHFLMEHDDKLYYRYEPRENKSPMRNPIQ